ncbi:pentatricopeptide repeat-containing protein [Tanacetum coccineum]
MLEAMRMIMLELMNTIRQLMEAWTCEICSNIKKRLELAKDEQRFWHVIPAGGNLFEVRNSSKAFKVDKSLRTCSCHISQLSGIACPHVVAVIFKLNRWVKDYLPNCFRKEMYIQAYS